MISGSYSAARVCRLLFSACDWILLYNLMTLTRSPPGLPACAFTIIPAQNFFQYSSLQVFFHHIRTLNFSPLDSLPRPRQHGSSRVYCMLREAARIQVSFQRKGVLLLQALSMLRLLGRLVCPCYAKRSSLTMRLGSKSPKIPTPPAFLRDISFGKTCSPKCDQDQGESWHKGP